MAKLKVPFYGDVVIPTGVTDLPTFRKWVHSGVLPEKLAVHFLQGDAWMDLFKEAFSHNLVKVAVTTALENESRTGELGIVFSDGMLLTNDEAQLATEPDAMFISYESLDAKRVWFDAGDTTGADATELVGSPDLVVEVISPSSEDKDTEWLMSQYHAAEIPEYWLIDARPATPQFDIFKRTTKEYVAISKRGGWLKSPGLGKSFRLTRLNDRLGFPHYSLEVR